MTDPQHVPLWLRRLATVRTEECPGQSLPGVEQRLGEAAALSAAGLALLEEQTSPEGLASVLARMVRQDHRRLARWKRDLDACFR